MLQTVADTHASGSSNEVSPNYPAMRKQTAVVAREVKDNPEVERQKRQQEFLRRVFQDKFLEELNDPLTVDFAVNANGKVWRERLGEPMMKIGYMDRNFVLGIINAVADEMGTVINRENPYLEGNFPLDGSRFAAQIPPVVDGPVISIRKRASKVFPLMQYADERIMTIAQHDAIVRAVVNKKNIVIIGGTGSGKTTLVNSVIDEIVKAEPYSRILIFEDTVELQCKAENCVMYQTTKIPGHEVTMTDLLRISLRMRPNRILVGEVRGPEALDLLDVLNTGHPGGVCTYHADDVESALDRLHSLITRHKDAPEDEYIDRLIAQSVDVIVSIEKTMTGRVVNAVAEMKGIKNGRFCLESV